MESDYGVYSTCWRPRRAGRRLIPKDKDYSIQSDGEPDIRVRYLRMHDEAWMNRETEFASEKAGL